MERIWVSSAESHANLLCIAPILSFGMNKCLPLYHLKYHLLSLSKCFTETFWRKEIRISRRYFVFSISMSFIIMYNNNLLAFLMYNAITACSSLASFMVVLVFIAGHTYTCIMHIASLYFLPLQVRQYHQNHQINHH